MAGRKSPPSTATSSGIDAAKSTSRTTHSDVPMVLPLHNGDVVPAAAPAGDGQTGNSAAPANAASTATNEEKKVRRHKGLRFELRGEGDSGRSGFHPLHFFRVSFRSSSKVSAAVNVLWPFVPAAIACRYGLDPTPRNHLITFILSYIAMVPCANMIGFAGQELARKLPHVMGILTESMIGSIVEIVLFVVLVKRGLYAVVQAAILGSILATMLLCLGLCFFAGGLGREDQTFSETVSEAGSGLLLTAGFGLAVPTVFHHTLSSSSGFTAEELADKALTISRATAILLLLAYFVFFFFQVHSHHSIYDEIFTVEELNDEDGDSEKAKLTMTECWLALAVSVALVSLIALSLVEEIEFIVEERHISDAFMGLILVPLVEKAAEHLTAVDEAWDNQMNFALAHVLGATLQTALFNGPLAVIVGWGLHRPMGLDFELFDIVVLILAILTVGNFLRDQKSNYLEGFLCVIVYISIAVAAYHYPNPTEASEAEA